MTQIDANTRRPAVVPQWRDYGAVNGKPWTGPAVAKAMAGSSSRFATGEEDGVIPDAKAVTHPVEIGVIGRNASLDFGADGRLFGSEEGLYLPILAAHGQVLEAFIPIPEWVRWDYVQSIEEPL